MSLNSKRYRLSITAWQNFSRFIFAPVFALMNRGVSIEFQAAELKPGTHYVVASNHQSALDSFVQLGMLDTANYRRLRPFRAMTLNPYFNSIPFKWGALAMGCFPAKPHLKYPFGQAFAADLLTGAPQTVFICPEGGRTLPGIKPARPGVAALARLDNVEIIPAHIQWYHSGVLGRSFKLTLGGPIDARTMTAQAILDAIYALPLPR